MRKPHVVISRHSPFADNVVPRLVAMATSIRPSNLDLGYVFIGLLDSENLATPRMKQRVAIQPKLYRFKVYLPHPTHQRGQPISEGTPSMFGMDVFT